MIRNNEFIKRKIGTQYVIVATGNATKNFNGMISVNTTGSYIWDLLKQEMTVDDIVLAMTSEYEVDADTAKAHVIEFTDRLKGVGAIAE